MGIIKLTSYVDSNYHDWEDVKLEDHPIVLDGAGLQYYLSKRANLEWKFGGQYPVLRACFKSFFDALREKNVQPVHIIFDGVDPDDKLETLKGRKKRLLETIIESIDAGGHGKDILPPLTSEVFRSFLHDYNSEHDNMKLYAGDEEADSLGVVIANKYNCPLLGNDSDYFVSALKGGYIPYDKLNWTKPGEPILGKMYRRDSFARSLGIDHDMVLAIPAIVGNDSIPNLVNATSLRRIKDNPHRHDWNDTEKVIIFIKSQRSMENLESNLQSQDGMQVFHRFKDNLKKAREMYEGNHPFDEREFRMTCSYKTNSGNQFPAWMIEQYRDLKFIRYFFEVLLKSQYFHHVIPDDYQQESCKVFSRPIRQVMFSILEVRGSVREVIRVGKQLAIQEVHPISSSDDLSIYHEMDSVPEDERVCKLCSVLQCDPSTLSVLGHRNWYIPVASVCYWAKNARIPDVKVRALLLCFAECYYNDTSSFQPVFNVTTLHTLTQWQCVFHDAVLLNEILALPLPYLSAAQLFDGKRLSFYFQQDRSGFLDERLSSAQADVRRLYDQLLSVVNMNL